MFLTVTISPFGLTVRLPWANVQWPKLVETNPLDAGVAAPGTALTATSSPANPSVISATRMARLVSVFIRDSLDQVRLVEELAPPTRRSRPVLRTRASASASVERMLAATVRPFEMFVRLGTELLVREGYGFCYGRQAILNGACAYRVGRLTVAESKTVAFGS